MDAALPVHGFAALEQVGALRLYRISDVDFPALDTVAWELAIEQACVRSLLRVPELRV